MPAKIHCCMVSLFMTKMCCKYIALIALSLASSSVMAGGHCIELEKYVTTEKRAHFSCQSETGTFFGYDIAAQRPLLAVYNVLKRPYSEYIRNQGVYSAISDLPIQQQTDPRTYLRLGLDVGYLVAPYLFLTTRNQSVKAFTVANAFPIEKHIWRGAYNAASFNVDKIERKMFDDKGDVVAMYGLINTNGEPSSVYRVYYQPQYQLSIAFLLPLSTDVNTTPSNLITSIDCIESLAGVEFLSFLDKKTQADIKIKKASSVDVWARKDGNGEMATCE